MDFKLTDEQRMWKKAIHDFCAAEVRPAAAEMDKHATFNQEAVHKMGPLGLLGLNVPEENGGAGGSQTHGFFLAREALSH